MLKKQIKRDQVRPFFRNLDPSLIGMKAYGSAHHWARKLSARGHTVKLMAPQFVKPYVKAMKNDAADAEAIGEALSCPNMRFVPGKTVESQALLAVHRARQGFVKARTAQANQIRGLLSEFGIIIPLGISHIAKRRIRSWKMARTTCPRRSVRCWPTTGNSSPIANRPWRPRSRDYLT